jgi:GT2 family glycosyltransferase
VVVVAYHGPDELDRCLACLDAVGVTVVDNSSSVAVREVAASRGAAYVDARANVGFAAGVNLGLQGLMEKGLTDVLLLNPDARISPGDLDVLSAFLAEHARVAAVSPRLLNDDGTEQRAAWPFPSPVRAALEAVGLGRVSARTGPSFVVGAVMLLRGEAIQQVGLFDERFFLYAEEADWQRRAADLGWVSAVCHEAVAGHRGAGASDDAGRREALFHAAQETYIRKWHGRAGWWLYRVVTCIGAAARALLLTRDRRSAAARRAVLYLRGPRRCAAHPLD